MATRLFKNARIFTSQPEDNDLHEAIVVAGDKVAFVGNAADAEAFAAKSGNVETVDLKGQLVIPGMIDAHTHLSFLGSSLTKVPLLGKNIEQIKAALQAERKAKPDAPMVLGCQFQYDMLGVPPHRKFLDDIFPDVPVILDSSCLHSTWLNSAAIRAIGVNEDTPNPKGGEFVRDADGLTGWFKETATMQYVWPLIARQTDIEGRIALYHKVFETYLEVGVTGAIDMALSAEDLEALEAYCAKYGRTPIRIAAHWLLQPHGTDEDRAEQVRTAAAHRDRLAHLAPWLTIAGVKVVSDGVLDSCTAFLLEPYPNGETPGPIWPGPELNKVVALADSLDLQVAVHAIGDAASVQALDAYEYAIAQNGPRPARRHRIEHLEVVSKESIARLTKLRVIASMQPVHADPVKVVNWNDQLAHDHRCDRGFPWKEFEDAGSHVAFGSDAPTAPYEPMPNLYTATTRKSAINPSLPDPTDERVKALSKLCVSLETAIRYYTAGSAHSMRAENETGQLAPGMSADFCVMDIDPFRAGLETLRQAQRCNVATYVAGELVWSRK